MIHLCIVAHMASSEGRLASAPAEELTHTLCWHNEIDLTETGRRMEEQGRALSYREGFLHHFIA